MVRAPAYRLVWWPGILTPLTFVVALVVFGWRAGRPAFWVDEYLTQRAVARSWPDLVAWMASDPGPAPYYVVMKVWSYASVDPLWLRVPSVVAMAGGLAVVAALTRWLAGPLVACAAVVILLGLSVISRFGQENRPYALALLATVTAVAGWLRVVERPGSRRALVWFGAAVGAMGLAHLYTLTVLQALALACAFRVRGDRAWALRRTVGPALVAVLVISPHLVANLRHPTGSPTDEPVSWTALRGLLGRMMPYPVALGLLVLAVLGVAYAVRTPRLRPAVVVALCWAVVPTVVLLAAKLAVDLPVMKVRYLLFVLPAVALLAAVGLRQLAAWWRPSVVLVLAGLVVVGLPGQVQVREVGGHNRDWALGPILGVADHHGIPVVVANRQAVRLVDAATYPHARLRPSADPRTTHYAVVVERVSYAKAVPDRFVFYRPSGPWRQVLRCPVTEASVLVFESLLTPRGERDPGPDQLGTELTAATGGEVGCLPVDALTR